jgi:hypothetical protein
MPCFGVQRTMAAIILVGLLAGVGPQQASGQDPKKLNDKIIEIAGTAEFLRSVPKHFATLKAVDTAKHQVTLLIDDEKLAKVWTLVPDAEIKVLGWWGRLDQLHIGDRVWVWFKTDRNKQAVAISMLADEISEQDIHGPGVQATETNSQKVNFKPVKGIVRSLLISTAMLQRGDQVQKDLVLKAGEQVYVQSTGDKARLILDPAAFKLHRDKQKDGLRQRWIKDGLPGTAGFVHVFSGEMDLLLDHEAMRWGRSLKVGDKVTLRAEPPIKALVKGVQPWRERTQLRLVVNSFDLADLQVGQRLFLLRDAPPSSVDSDLLPPDCDRPRSKQERLDWFLASVYCTCKVSKDTCTGHFYTLASCNPNGCGMPNQMREVLAGYIDKGLSDREIFDLLLKKHGPDLLRPHLLP